MINLTHLRYEVVRTFRSHGFFIITMGMPMVLYCTVAPCNDYERVGNLPFSSYFMTGMAAYGALFAVFSPTTRMAIDRSRGWARQIQVTPLRPATYMIAKVITAFMVALPALVLLFAVGVAFGVRLTATQWLQLTGLLLVGLIPFIVMGITIGHLVRADVLPMVIGGLVVLFALFGGAFGEFFGTGVMMEISKLLPSYWLVHVGLGTADGGWGAQGWIVVGAWTAAMLALAVPAYLRDTRGP